MASKLKGGKTAPKLLSDLLLYDPTSQRGDFNLLVEVPRFEEDRWIVDPTPSKDSCRHAWALDEDHTNLPPLSLRLASLSKFWVVAHCTNCRSQLGITLTKTPGAAHNLCPTTDSPLHHFLHQPGSPDSFSAVQDSTHSAGSRDVHEFICTSAACTAKLQVVLQPARLIPRWVKLLTDQEVIRDRAERAIASDPERLEGLPVPTGAVVLSNLRTYLRNGLDSSEPKVIRGINKRWLVSLGDPCIELLIYLGFEKRGDDWLGPAPGPAADPPSTENLRNRIHHVENELSILLSKRSAEERRAEKIDVIFDHPYEALRKLLGTTNYKTKPGWQPTGPTEAEHPFYAGLGVVGDFHDELITFAYDRQITVDPDNLAYYLECLQGICDGRKGPEDLQTKVLMEQTADKISSRDLRSAYRNLGIAANLDDETILGAFQARLGDTPSHQEGELREALKMVGLSRSSRRLQDAASMEVKTYEQALSFLNVSEEFADDAVIAMYTTKVHDSDLDEPRAREAVRLIAEHRNSSALRAWCSTGELGEVEMDIGHAYNRLEISDRTVDDEMVLVAFNTYVTETPSQLEDLRKALKAIATSRNSRLLLNELGMHATSEGYSTSEWPVGLKNIGNTCYLNSLLQSYFTVKPLRELVLDFERYRMHIDAQSLATKQVGSRQISRQEVERAQKFALQLQKLFESMITAPHSEVEPEQELAQLTLMSSTIEEQVRRRSTLRGTRPSLGEINGETIIGPLPPPDDQPAQSDFEMIENPVNTNPHSHTRDNDPSVDDSSSVTLIDVSVPGEEDADMDDMEGVKNMQQGILDDKENLPPSKQDSVRPMTPEPDLFPLSETSPSRANRQVRTLSPVRESETDGRDVDMHIDIPPPNRPPPIPPRPDQQPKVSIREQLEIGAQQDVTEVIGNVLFQLQCAIKPEQIDHNGEQIDTVKRLFYGKIKSTTIDRAGTERTSEAFFSDIKVNVFSDPPPTDIYAALDGAFDEQDVEIGGAVEPQYTTISQLPPVLQIHINRANFDREKQANIKSDHLFDFDDTIYMDRYTDLTDPDLLERRVQKWAWKKQLLKLEAERKAMGKDVSDKLAQLRALLKEINGPEEDSPIMIPQGLVERLEAEELRCKQEAHDVASQIKDLRTYISTQFVDQKKICYRLHSVFIHRGGATSGHYWIYIYDFEHKIWRKYNDERVIKVDASEIFSLAPSTSPSTPYFLTYVRDGHQKQLVDCVRRDPVELPSEPIEDTVMEDVIPSVEIDHIEDAHPQNNGLGYQKQEYVPVTKWDSSTEWDSSNAEQLSKW